MRFKLHKNESVQLIQLHSTIPALKIFPIQPLIPAVLRLTEGAREKWPVTLTTYIHRYT